tara:strand:+ start:190 stop:513 length:324 start_codon:yes stop_codon:yes gene_type:complete
VKMLWVYLIASVGLAGIIVETWFSHRKATAQVREDITRVRTGIRQHQSATTAIEDKRKAAEEHSRELTAEREKYAPEVELKRQELEELVEIWRKHHPVDPFDDMPRI